MAVLFASRNRDRAGFGVDAVLDKFRNGFQRIALRQCNDRDRIPVVADLELAVDTHAVFQICCCHRNKAYYRMTNASPLEPRSKLSL